MNLEKLRVRSAVVLIANDPAFGGFSGLLVEDAQMVAVSDRGHWLFADLIDGPDGLRVGSAELVPMQETDGTKIEGSGADAEGLTIRNEILLVSFERDHRVMSHAGEGRLGEPLRAAAFEKLTGNQGLEALATLPDGSLIAIAERPEGESFPVYLISHAGMVRAGVLPKLSRHHVTGADIDDQGRLYLLLRDFSLFRGVSIRVHRYAVDEEGFPVAESIEVLADIEGASGIDNMEGIAVWRDQNGTARLTLISDDNFNLIQRTLLVDFEIKE